MINIKCTPNVRIGWWASSTPIGTGCPRSICLGCVVLTKSHLVHKYKENQRKLYPVSIQYPIHNSMDCKLKCLENKTFSYSYDNNGSNLSHVRLMHSKV